MVMFAFLAGLNKAVMRWFTGTSHKEFRKRISNMVVTKGADAKSNLKVEIEIIKRKRDGEQ
jgi:hypothetical protein